MSQKSASLKYQADSVRAIGGADSLRPIEYCVLKPSAPRAESLLEQASKNIDQLELLQKQLHFMLTDVKSLVIKN